MSRFTSKPGPFPISCITCRRRRKKCDLGRPCCERCLKGGFECLGYEADKLCARVRTENVRLRTPSQPTSTPPAIQVEVVRSNTLDSLPTGLPDNQQNSIDTNSRTDHDVMPSLPGAALLRGMSQPFISVKDDCAPTDPLDDFDYSWPQEQSQITVHSHPPARRSSCARRSFYMASGVRPTSDDLSRALKSLCRSIPPSVDAKQMMREEHFARVIEDSRLLLVYSPLARHPRLASGSSKRVEKNDMDFIFGSKALPGACSTSPGL
ncbi:hypothetical protein B0J17DRAFT_241068 [Rhizoctonia solani]|nr:hypothetical protein B0J17DRAFT_241068 [Rhizoctonia solani]